jgi:hypothetical protein
VALLIETLILMLTAAGQWQARYDSDSARSRCHTSPWSRSRRPRRGRARPRGPSGSRCVYASARTYTRARLRVCKRGRVRTMRCRDSDSCRLSCPLHSSWSGGSPRARPWCSAVWRRPRRPRCSSSPTQSPLGGGGGVGGGWRGRDEAVRRRRRRLSAFLKERAARASTSPALPGIQGFVCACVRTCARVRSCVCACAYERDMSSSPKPLMGIA